MHLHLFRAKSFSVINPDCRSNFTEYILTILIHYPENKAGQRFSVFNVWHETIFRSENSYGKTLRKFFFFSGVEILQDNLVYKLNR